MRTHFDFTHHRRSTIYNAISVRVRDYPITLEKHLDRLPMPV